MRKAAAEALSQCTPEVLAPLRSYAIRQSSIVDYRNAVRASVAYLIGMHSTPRQLTGMASANLTVYTYSNCSTCRNATRLLRDHGVDFREKPIRDTPPSADELRVMLRYQHGEVRRLFNTSGKDYRALNLKERLPQLSDAEAIKLLAANGNLIKRPFLLGRDVGLVGFNADAWSTLTKKNR